MRRWLNASAASATQVAERPALWLPGALAWTVGVGWLALVIGVARAPSVAELTFFGAGMFTSGAWPWNVVALAAAATALVVVAFLLASLAESRLLSGRPARGIDVARLFAIGLVAAAPTMIAVAVLATAVAVIAPGEFNAPDDGSPLARTALQLAPFGLGALGAVTAGAAFHAAAIRVAIRGRSVPTSLASAPRRLLGGGTAGALHAVAVMLLRAAYLALAAVLLRVLWAPIGIRLEGEGMDAAVALLLVGFVSIWLCLVLGGGALHAWGSLTWTRVLDAPAADAGRAMEPMETHTGP